MSSGGFVGVLTKLCITIESGFLFHGTKEVLLQRHFKLLQADMYMRFTGPVLALSGVDTAPPLIGVVTVPALSGESTARGSMKLGEDRFKIGDPREGINWTNNYCMGRYILQITSNNISTARGGGGSFQR